MGEQRAQFNGRVGQRQRDHVASAGRANVQFDPPVDGHPDLKQRLSVLVRQQTCHAEQRAAFGARVFTWNTARDSASPAFIWKDRLLSAGARLAVEHPGGGRPQANPDRDRWGTSEIRAPDLALFCRRSSGRGLPRPAPPPTGHRGRRARGGPAPARAFVAPAGRGSGRQRPTPRPRSPRCGWPRPAPPRVASTVRSTSSEVSRSTVSVADGSRSALHLRRPRRRGRRPPSIRPR